VGSTPQWVTVLSALLTPTVALLGSYIAWQQWRTAKHKLVLDLFDRRLKVITALKQAMAEILRQDKAEFHHVMEFLRAGNDAAYLFGSDVNDFLDATHKRLNALRVKEARRNFKVGSEREQAFDQEQAANGMDRPCLPAHPSSGAPSTRT
jgi:Zn-dependent M32 family carboxypeptidase